MKKWLIIILMIICICIISFIFVDTIQARIFGYSPFISWKKDLTDNDSWVDRGLIIDTYYCTREKDIQTIYWRFKWNKFDCPIDNEIHNNSSKKDRTMIDLLIEKMIEEEILNKSNLASFEVLSIFEYGYYRSEPTKKYVEFDFRYTCKDKSKNCITESSKMFSTISSDKDYNVIWAYTDGKKIYKLSNGVSIDANADFVFLGGEKRIIGLIK